MTPSEQTSTKSSMYRRNNTGPRQLPWITPLIITFILDSALPTRVCCVRPVKKSAIYYGTGEAHGAVSSSVRRQRAVNFIVSCSLFLVLVFNLPNVTHQSFLLTLYIYLQDFKHSHPTSLDAPSSPASVATRYLKSSLAFVHALYYFAWLRPLQLLTGRRRRRYPN